MNKAFPRPSHSRLFILSSAQPGLAALTAKMLVLNKAALRATRHKDGMYVPLYNAVTDIVPLLRAGGLTPGETTEEWEQWQQDALMLNCIEAIDLVRTSLLVLWCRTRIAPVEVQNKSLPILEDLVPNPCKEKSPVRRVRHAAKELARAANFVADTIRVREEVRREAKDVQLLGAWQLVSLWAQVEQQAAAARLRAECQTCVTSSIARHESEHAFATVNDYSPLEECREKHAAEYRANMDWIKMAPEFPHWSNEPEQQEECELVLATLMSAEPRSEYGRVQLHLFTDATAEKVRDRFKAAGWISNFAKVQAVQGKGEESPVTKYLEITRPN